MSSTSSAHYLPTLPFRPRPRLRAAPRAPPPSLPSTAWGWGGGANGPAAAAATAAHVPLRVSRAAVRRGLCFPAAAAPGPRWRSQSRPASSVSNRRPRPPGLAGQRMSSRRDRGRGRGRTRSGGRPSPAVRPASSLEPLSFCEERGAASSGPPSAGGRAASVARRPPPPLLAVGREPRLARRVE